MTIEEGECLNCGRDCSGHFCSDNCESEHREYLVESREVYI